MASVAFSLAFWVYFHLILPPHSIYIDVAFVGVLGCGIPAALIAA
jgi:hypothetical protein